MADLAFSVEDLRGDLPGADSTETQARELLNLPGCEETPVVRVSSKSGQGIAELWSLLVDRPHRDHSTSRDARRLLRLVQEHTADWFAEHSGKVHSIVDHWTKGESSDEQAVRQILNHLLGDDTSNTMRGGRR